VECATYTSGEVVGFGGEEDVVVDGLDLHGSRLAGLGGQECLDRIALHRRRIVAVAHITQEKTLVVSYIWRIFDHYRYV
jgi:hypothetical protein